MSDQARWLKLWGSALGDPHLENLSLENWARYIRLMLYTKCHGKMGKIRFPYPFQALKSLFRLDDEETVISILKAFPNVIFRRFKRNGENIVTDTKETIDIVFLNWHKYQVDSSNERVRRFRQRKSFKSNTAEEKRREESNDDTSTSRAAGSGSVETTPSPLARETPNTGKPEWAKTSADLPESERMTPEDWAKIKNELRKGAV